MANFNIYADRKGIIRALETVGKIVPNRVPYETCGCALIVSDREQGTTLETTTGDTAIRDYVLGVQVNDSGSALIPVKETIKALKGFSDDRVLIEWNGNGLTIKGEHSLVFVSFRADVEQFKRTIWPTCASVLEMGTREYRQSFERTGWTVDMDSCRYAMSGINLELQTTESSLRFVATDGRKIAYTNASVDMIRRFEETEVADHEWSWIPDVKPSGQENAVLPYGVAKILDSIVAKDKKGIEKIAIGFKQRIPGNGKPADEATIDQPGEIHIQYGNIEFWAKLVNGRFPRWIDAVPNQLGTQATFSSHSALLNAIKPALSSANLENEQGLDFVMLDDHKRMYIHHVSSKTIDFETSVAIDRIDGASRNARLDAHYVADILKSGGASSQKITILIEDHKQATVFVFGDGARVVMMPICEGGGKDPAHGLMLPSEIRKTWENEKAEIDRKQVELVEENARKERERVAKIEQEETAKNAVLAGARATQDAFLALPHVAQWVADRPGGATVIYGLSIDTLKNETIENLNLLQTMQDEITSHRAGVVVTMATPRPINREFYRTVGTPKGRAVNPETIETRYTGQVEPFTIGYDGTRRGRGMNYTSEPTRDECIKSAIKGIQTREYPAGLVDMVFVEVSRVCSACNGEGETRVQLKRTSKTVPCKTCKEQGVFSVEIIDITEECKPAHVQTVETSTPSSGFSEPMEETTDVASDVADDTDDDAEDMAYDRLVIVQGVAYYVSYGRDWYDTVSSRRDDGESRRHENSFNHWMHAEPKNATDSVFAWLLIRDYKINLPVLKPIDRTIPDGETFGLDNGARNGWKRPTQRLAERLDGMTEETTSSRNDNRRTRVMGRTEDLNAALANHLGGNDSVYSRPRNVGQIQASSDYVDSLIVAMEEFDATELRDMAENARIDRQWAELVKMPCPQDTTPPRRFSEQVDVVAEVEDVVEPLNPLDTITLDVSRSNYDGTAHDVATIGTVDVETLTVDPAHIDTVGDTDTIHAERLQGFYDGWNGEIRTALGRQDRYDFGLLVGMMVWGLCNPEVQEPNDDDATEGNAAEVVETIELAEVVDVETIGQAAACCDVHELEPCAGCVSTVQPVAVQPINATPLGRFFEPSKSWPKSADGILARLRENRERHEAAQVAIVEPIDFVNVAEVEPAAEVAEFEPIESQPESAPLPAVFGKRVAAGLTLDIDGRGYVVEIFPEGQGFGLERLDGKGRYVVTPGGPNGWECECPSFEHVAKDSATGCKHIQALRGVGLLALAEMCQAVAA